MFFFRKQQKAEREDTYVWKTHERKIWGICQQIRNLLASQQVTLIVTPHFLQAYEELIERFEREGILYTGFSGTTDRFEIQSAMLFADTSRVIITLSDLLMPLSPENQPKDMTKGVKIQIIAPEHHPLRQRDEAIEAFADSIRQPCKLGFHAALDEPLIQLFGGQSVTRMMGSLGMPEGEHLSSPFLSKALENAQQKIAQKVSGDIFAKSAEDWFALNFPDLPSG